MKYLFVDTNVWLSLYSFSKNQLSEFSKLKGLIGTDIKLLLTQQVHDEIIRNRDNKIKDALKGLEFKKISFPVFCKDYSDYSEINSLQNDLERKIISFKRKIEADISNRNLAADMTIKTFFYDVAIIPCDAYVEKASQRYLIGNPPGKDNKYGDAINWECLLDKVPNGHDLYFISDDKDYKSSQDSQRFNLFLEMEWKEKKSSNIHYYSKLVDFLNQHFDDIKLEVERQKNALINQLAHSLSFYETHIVIANLFDYLKYSKEQIEELCSIAETNEQVSRILSDYDVLTFYSKLLRGIDYFSLEDCATKRIMYSIFGDTIDQKIIDQKNHAKETDGE